MPDDDDTTTTPPADDAGDDDGSSSSSSSDDELEAIRTDPAAARKTMDALKTEAGDYRRRLRKAELELEQLKRASLSDQERAVAEAEARGRQTAEAEHGRRLLEAELRAAAAGKLRDPADALRYLELDDLLELDDGERELELGKRVDELVATKSYLAAANGDAGDGRVGVRSQGARTSPGGAKSADVDGSAWLRKAARRGS
jgi:hypothetical protein